jgi:hypothetical protein
MSDVPRQLSPDPFAQCPSGCVCGIRELIAREHDRGPRGADEIDAAEMRAMLIAVRSGYETVRSDPRLVERRHAANNAWGRAERQLNTMRTTINEERISQAATELDQARRATRGSRRRAGWLRWVRWPVVAGIGLFDVWYFGLVFRYLTSQTGDASGGGPSAPIRALETVVAVVPGLVLAIIIAASADLLARPLRTWKAAASRAPQRDAHTGKAGYALRVAGKWVQRITWWSLPLAFVAFLLFVVAIWAGLRARYPTPPSEGYPLISVMLLIVLLATGTMAVKLLADDRPAEELSAARRRLWLLRRSYLRRARRADRLIVAYDSAWSDLRTLRDDLVGLLRVKMLSAWEGFILRLRSLHRMAGNVTAAAGTLDNGQALVRSEFEGIPQPAMELGPLLEICRLIEQHNPDKLREDKHRLDEKYAAQVCATDGDAGELILRSDG